MENAVQRVQGLIRTLKDAVEWRLNENQVKRPDILVDGRVVSRIDHKICEMPNRQHRVQRGSWTRRDSTGRGVRRENHVHDITEHEPESTES